MSKQEMVKVDPAPLAAAEQNPLAMLQSMIERGADPAALTKMMDLVERMQAKVDERAFSRAMVGFKAECPMIEKCVSVKDRGGNHMYHIAPLEDIQGIVDPILAKHGLTYDFDMEATERGYRAVCRVRHGTFVHSASSEVRVATELRVSEPQKDGASQSFARRYALISALGLRVGGMESIETMAAMEQSNETVSPQQSSEIARLLGQCEEGAFDGLCNWVAAQTNRKIDGVSDIPAGMYPSVIDALNRKVRAAKAAKP